MPPVWHHMREDNMKPEQQPAATAVRSSSFFPAVMLAVAINITCSCSESDSNN